MSMIGSTLAKMFGGGPVPAGQVLPGQFDPSQLSGADRLAMAGAMMKDVGGSLRGGDSNDVLQMQQLLAGRQALAGRQRLLKQIMGEGDAPTIPQVVKPSTATLGRISTGASGQGDPSGVNLPQVGSTGGGVDLGALREPTPQPRGPMKANDPEFQRIALVAKSYGIDLGDYLKAQELAKPSVKIGPGGEAYDEHDPGALERRFRNPTNVNGWITDLNDPANEGKYLPTLPNGVMPTGRGGVDNITGLVPAMRAQEEAQTLGRTRGTMLNVPNGDGTTSLQTGAQYLDPQPGAGSIGGGGPIVPQRGGGGGRPGTTQRPDDAAYRAEAARSGQARMQGYIQGGQKAATSLNTYGRLQQLDQGVNGGKLAPLGADVASYASTLGVNLDPKLPNKEAIVALTNKLVLDGLGGSLGPGVSNSDVKFLQGMTPSLANTPQGRQQMVTYGIAVAKRQQRVATMASEWERRYGRIDNRDSAGRSFEDNLSSWAERNPLVPKR